MEKPKLNYCYNTYGPINQKAKAKQGSNRSMANYYTINKNKNTKIKIQ